MTVLEEDNEIIILIDGVVSLLGKTVVKDGRKIAHVDRPIKTMVQAAFVKDVDGNHAKEVHLTIGKGFRWALVYDDLASFDEQLLDMMDEQDFPFNESGEFIARIQVSIGQ